jgi:putative ABC transport system permease protein
MPRVRRRIPLLRLAWRNTRRQVRRTLLTVTAVMVAVAALTYGPAHVVGIMGDFLDTYARIESGHVQIRRDGYSARERFMPVYFNLPRVEELVAAVRAHAGVEQVLPRIKAPVLVDGAGSNRGGLLLGLDLEREEGYLDPAAMVSEGRLPQSGSAEILVGRRFAEKLRVSVGDTVVLLGQTAYRSLGGLSVVVTGIAVSGMAQLDNTILIAPLDQAQELVDLLGGSTEILVFMEDPEAAPALARDLQAELDPMVPGGVEVRSWREQGMLASMMQVAEVAFGIMLFIMLLMAALIIVNTMLMSVMERTQEFGMQAALGMRRSDIVALVLTEGLVIGIMGAIAGGALGTGFALWLERTGIDVSTAMEAIDIPFQGIFYPDWQLRFVIAAAAIGMVAAVIAALYPAWRAARLTPAEALRA